MPPRATYSPIVIEAVRPSVECGRFRAKAVVGDRVPVTADIFRDGTAELGAVVRYRRAGASRWAEAPLTHEGNDAWAEHRCAPSFEGAVSKKESQR